MPDITRIPDDPDYFQPATNPDDVAVKERNILQSIAAKQARYGVGPQAATAGVVDANGYRQPPPQQ